MSSHDWLGMRFALRSLNLKLEAQSAASSHGHPRLPLCLGKHGNFIPIFLPRHFRRIIAAHSRSHQTLKMPTLNVTSRMEQYDQRLFLLSAPTGRPSERTGGVPTVVAAVLTDQRRDVQNKIKTSNSGQTPCGRIKTSSAKKNFVSTFRN